MADLDPLRGAHHGAHLMHSNPCCLALLLLTCAATAACGDLPRHAERPDLPPTWREDASDTRSIIPPATRREAARVPYTIPHDLASPPEHGTLEAGSWADFSILAVIHADDPRADLEPSLAAQALPEDLRQRLSNPWRGPDKRAFTPDDAPYTGLDDLLQRAPLAPEDLGRLLWLARRSRVSLDPDPYRWHIAEGFAFSDLQASATLHAANTCDLPSLHDTFGLPTSTAGTLTLQRPLRDLPQLADLPRTSRRHLVRFAHLAPHLPCPDPEATDDTPLDPLVADALASTDLQRLRWLHTPEHTRDLRQHHAALLTDTLHTLQRQDARDDQALAALRDEARRLAFLHLLHPFDRFDPAQPASTQDDDLRAAAAEHLLHALTTQDLPQPWPDLLQDHADALISDLAALRQRGPLWTTYRDGDNLTLYGRLLGLFAEVTFHTPDATVQRVYIELD